MNTYVNNYLKDNSIPKKERMKVYNQLQQGTPPSKLEYDLKKNYGNKFGGGSSSPRIAIPPAKQQGEDKGGLATAALMTPVNLGIGAVKTAAGALRGGSSLLQRAGTALGGGLAGTVKGEGFRQGAREALERTEEEGGTAAERLIPDEAIEKKGAAQKVGGFAADVGLFLLPGAGGKGRAATQVATRGKKLVDLTRRALGKGSSAYNKLPTFAKGALSTGGITAVKEGDVNADVAAATALGGALPIATGFTKYGAQQIAGRTKLLENVTGLTNKFLSGLDDIAKKAKTKVGGKFQTIYNDAGDWFRDKGFLSDPKGVTREGLVDRANQLWEEAISLKPQLFNDIKKRIPVKTIDEYDKLIDYLGTKYTANQGLGQKQNIDFINKMRKAKDISAANLERIRYLSDATLPRGAYSGAEPIPTQGLEKVLNNIRGILEKADKSGKIKNINYDKQILAKLLGVGQKTSPLLEAARKGESGKVMRDVVIAATSGGGVGAIGGPVAGGAVLGTGLAKALSENPATAARLIKILEGAQKAGLKPGQITELLRAIGGASATRADL